MKRIFELDVLRGIAIVLMIIFHLGYDLVTFGWANYSTGGDIEWRIFRAIIVSCFLLAVGMSSYLAYHKQVNFRKLFFTVGKLLAVSIFITVSSLYMYPNSWVYFGIIHLITISLLFSVLFVRIPTVSAFIGTLIILAYAFDFIGMHSIWVWSVENIGIPKRTVDLASVIPWFGVVLLGIFVMDRQIFNLSLPANRYTNVLALLGKHSLVIYLVHQPIIFAGLTMIAYIIE